MKVKINENWNKFLLKEAMKQPEQLPDDVYVMVSVDESGESVSFYYVDEDGHKRSVNDGFNGTIDISKDFVGKCHGAWMVEWSVVAPGWGPLLYDVAMEWVTMRRSGLMSDRRGVSGKAYEVWQHYMNNRSDVETVQLDNLENELTPEEKDNCAQEASLGHGNSRDIEWHKTPTSKVYMKRDPEMIRKLQSMDKLIFNEPDF